MKNLLTCLRDRGLPTEQQYLFVIDGAKALRAGIKEVFGSDQPVQRCRNHKMRNVLDELRREQHAQVINLMRATWELTECDKGMKRLEGLARFLENDYESAARSVREGMAEMFAIQKRCTWLFICRTTNWIRDCCSRLQFPGCPSLDLKLAILQNESPPPPCELQAQAGS